MKLVLRPNAPLKSCSRRIREHVQHIELFLGFIFDNFIGLAFCIERVIYLTLSEIDTDKFMAALDGKIASGDIEGAKTVVRSVAKGLVKAGKKLASWLGL